MFRFGLNINTLCKYVTAVIWTKPKHVCVCVFMRVFMCVPLLMLWLPSFFVCFLRLLLSVRRIFCGA